MITYESVLGVVINTVVSSLKDFYLEYISPAHARRKNPISKWLKGSVPELNIGTAPGSYVYVGWDDKAVLPNHAALTYVNGQVYIEPKGQTLVNSKAIKKKTRLRNNDLIKLGDRSITTLHFVISKP